MRNGNDHIFLGNHVFNREIALLRHYFGTAGITVNLTNFQQLLPDNLHLFLRAAENKPQLLNQCKYFNVFLINLLALHTGQTLEAHLKNCFRLQFRQSKAHHEPLLGCGRIR